MPFKRYRYKKGDPIKAEEFNELLDEIHKATKITVHPPLEMSNLPNGIELRWGGTTGEIVKGKLDATLNKDGSADMSVWAWDGSAEADTGEDIEVHDWLLQSGQTISSGDKVIVGFDGRSGRYYVIAAECDTDST